MEIEAPSLEKIDEAIEILCLNHENKKIFSTYQAYELKGINFNDYQEVILMRMVKKI